MFNINSINDRGAIVDPELNRYVFVIDKESGVRKTPLLIGVHGDTEAECLEKAKEEYPDCLLVTGGEDEQQLFYKGVRYVDGAFLESEPPTPEQVQASTLAALDAEYSAIFADYDEQIIRAVTVDQDEEYAEELRREKAEKQAEYAEKRGEL